VDDLKRWMLTIKSFVRCFDAGAVAEVLLSFRALRYDSVYKGQKAAHLRRFHLPAFLNTRCFIAGTRSQLCVQAARNLRLEEAKGYPFAVDSEVLFFDAGSFVGNYSVAGGFSVGKLKINSSKVGGRISPRTCATQKREWEIFNGLE
jgi:hypothetical protein